MQATGAPPLVTAGVAAAEAATGAAQIAADWIGQAQVPDDSAAGLHEVLALAVSQVIDEIEGRMRNVAAELTEVLAAVIDQFYDGFTRAPGVEKEFVKLCGPIRQELWPDTFDGRTDELAAGLADIARAASSSSLAASGIHAAAAEIRPRDR